MYQITIWLKRFAYFFIVLAIICAAASLLVKCIDNTLVGISTTFATLAGAILVFSTLELQNKALKEEISKNTYSRFDSRFYPILSSFRMDAANMENVVDKIRERGRGYGLTDISTYYGEMAFHNNRKLLEFLYDNMRKDRYMLYNEEDIRNELKEMAEIETYLCEKDESDEEIDKIVSKRANYLHSKQPGYLFYKYGITEVIWRKYKSADKQLLYSFLLGKLLEHQPTILSKYIQSLRFILKIIGDLPNEIDKKDYYLNVSCQLGKEELLFLKCFNEFDTITKRQL